MSANQRNIFGGVSRWLTVVLAAGIGAYLIAGAQQRASTSAKESAPAPDAAAEPNSTPAGATAEPGVAELTPEQILLFSSKSVLIEPAMEDAPVLGQPSGASPAPAADAATVPTFLHSSKWLAPTSSGTLVVPVAPLLFGTKSFVIDTPTPSPAPPPAAATPATSGAPAPVKPFLGSSKRLEPPTSQPAGGKPVEAAPKDVKPKRP